MTWLSAGRNHWHCIPGSSLPGRRGLWQIKAGLCCWQHRHHTRAGWCWHQVSSNWGETDSSFKCYMLVLKVNLKTFVRCLPAFLLAQIWPYMGLISYQYPLLVLWCLVSPPNYPTLTSHWPPCSWTTPTPCSCLKPLTLLVEPELLGMRLLKFHVRSFKTGLVVLVREWCCWMYKIEKAVGWLVPMRLTGLEN